MRHRKTTQVVTCYRFEDLDHDVCRKATGLKLFNIQSITIKIIEHEGGLVSFFPEAIGMKYGKGGKIDRRRSPRARLCLDEQHYHDLMMECAKEIGDDLLIREIEKNILLCHEHVSGKS